MTPYRKHPCKHSLFLTGLLKPIFTEVLRGSTSTDDMFEYQKLSWVCHQSSVDVDPLIYQYTESFLPSLFYRVFITESFLPSLFY